ncbi:hypothetical protein BDC45DRAFT_569049 [Circinella umbellata]|nr:hypothetical protein BDC45DRAFT_569049 [Circinella umbellata]
MRHYGRVSQIRVYVDPATGLYEGEVTIILDITPPTDYMTLWKNAPPLCRYCKAEGHKKDVCPKMIDMEYYNCHTKGHQQCNCRVQKEDEKRKRYADKIDHMTTDELLATYIELTQKIQNLQEPSKKQQQQQKEQEGKQQQSVNEINTQLPPPSVNTNKINEPPSDADSEMKEAAKAFIHTVDDDAYL